MVWGSSIGDGLNSEGLKQPSSLVHRLGCKIGLGIDVPSDPLTKKSEIQKPFFVFSPSLRTPRRLLKVE